MNTILVTGGAGFIGTNLAHRLLSEGKPVLLYDNLSQLGAVGETLDAIYENSNPGAARA